MTRLSPKTLALLVALALLPGCRAAAPRARHPRPCPTASWKSWSAKPPMGWNSFDCYGYAVNETQFRAAVDWLAQNLLPYGYEYAVIDIAWYRPAQAAAGEVNAAGADPNDRPRPVTMDRYGRALPAPDRFPSAADGQGFKTLADYVHRRGLKFGIHIMRGIPRRAVAENTPVLGASYRAPDFAAPYDTCSWNNDMYGLDPDHPGAQAYYNSLFDLYARWGVDFIKADDMMVPPYHKAEIEMMRRAIDQCGRPIVLSLSCGEAPISFAPHLEQNANMYRISIDFWDDWTKLLRLFQLAHAWSPFIGGGAWPDNDMLPIGRLRVFAPPADKSPPRDSRLTEAEHYTLMTLWCISRSPLFWGGDPLSSSPWSVSFLQNREVLAVNQNSSGNRQIFHGYGDNFTQRVWFADLPDSPDKYLALFNIGNDALDVKFAFYWENLRGRYRIRDLWKHQDLGLFENEFTRNLPAHGAGLYRLSPAPDSPIFIAPAAAAENRNPASSSSAAPSLAPAPPGRTPPGPPCCAAPTDPFPNRTTPRSAAGT